MNNYSRISSNLEEKIRNFSQKVSNRVKNKKKREFVSDMMRGLIASSSCNLANISRTLKEKEKITLRAIEKRLSRNLNQFNNGSEDISTYEDIGNKIIFDNYQNEIKNKVDDNTVFCFDPGDITKQYTKKFEGIDIIKDGSTGEFRPGYHMIEVAGLTKNEKLPIPVYTRLFSQQEDGFISTNDEYFKAIEYLGNQYNKKGTFAMDRGFDDIKYLKKLTDLELNFVIRMTKKRDVADKDGKSVENIKKKANKVKTKCQYTYKDKKGITRTAQAGYTKITIPGIENKILYLVVIKSTEFPNNPMMLVTNLKPENEEFTKIVNKVYIFRWKIEEYFRFKKQQFGFEKEMVRTLNSIRTLNTLLTIAIGFIAMFSDNQKQVQYSVVFESSESLRKNEEIVMVYYAIETGLKNILRYSTYVKQNKRKKKTNIIEGQISIFKN